MAKYLLDTHIFLWWMSDADQLSKEVFDIISDTSNQIYIGCNLKNTKPSFSL